MGHTTNKQVFYIILGLYSTCTCKFNTHTGTVGIGVNGNIGRATWNTGKAILSGGATAGGLCSTIVALYIVVGILALQLNL